MAQTTVMILCDTNILIEFYRNNPDVVLALRRIGVEQLAVSAVTVAELYFGARDKSELHQLRQHLGLVATLHVTEAVSSKFLSLMEDYTLSHGLSIPDALIAATALHFDLSLYTLNVKDFRFIPGLRLYDPAGRGEGAV